MKRLPFLLALVFIFTLSQCAKKGRPSGGPKDEDPPLFVTADPPYETVNFDKREIRLYFNEYIKLKDLNKQLIISPPLNPENPSLITPQGSPSKYISIQLIDTLLENTTYIFDFGNSVEDNNESNKLERFKYVFSTGDYIDSLKMRGSVKNSLVSDDVKNIKLLLYRLDSTYTDSAIYKFKPDYVTSSLDTSLYQFTNMRAGKYLLMALEDKSSDYLFDPKQDRIGFYNDTITLPQDSVVSTPISLFKEILPFQFKRGKEERKGKLIFGYEGNAEGFELELMSDVPDDFKTVSFFDTEKDTVNLWHSPIEADSLMFKVIRGSVIDTSIVKLRKKKLDSLSITNKVRSFLEFNDTLFFDANNPIVAIDTSKVSFFDKDTIPVPFSTFLSDKEPKVGILFEKKLQQDYQIKLLPEAFTDIFNQTSDSLDFKFKTRKIEDYGDIILTIQNTDSKNVIIQLTDPKDVVVRQQVVKTSSVISFQYLLPKKYKIRIVYDENENGKWDTGDFLERIQPETVEYFKDEFELRSNFSYNETITIKP